MLARTRLRPAVNEAGAAPPPVPHAAPVTVPRGIPPLDGQRVLLVYGLLGEVAAAFHPFGLDYMQPLATWLRGQGALVSVVQLRTAESVSANAARLRAEILADPAAALIIAHSKGGLEALAALLDPAAQARCIGFLAMQSPFYGSPIADVVVGAKPLEAAAGGLARLLRIGTKEGVRDLTTSARRAWMAARRLAIAVETIFSASSRPMSVQPIRRSTASRPLRK